uniref:Clip domain-containing protein n=1 Tax=Angiostrongylus cantonensis TaxID=6313 RepID=A0A0K0D0H1_ANGCA
MLPANFLVVWISLAGGLAYKLSQTSKLNGHLYTEVVEQPWFRYPHVVHVPHDWTDEEREYLPCMNLTCVCPYYKGKVSGGNCVLPNGKLLKKAVRKEARMLSNSERNQIASELPDPRDSMLFSSLFMGATNSTGYIVDGPYSNWKIMEGTRHVLRFVPDMSNGELLNNARIDFVLQQERIEQVLAAVMPLETRDQRETDYPPPLPDCYPETHFGNASLKDLEPYTNKDVLSNHYTDYMYEYDKWPRCSKSNPNCGSRYLFCHLVNSVPLCIAKIQPGGNCEGFEEASICYEGRCEQGRCIIVYDNDESLRGEQLM